MNRNLFLTFLVSITLACNLKANEDTIIVKEAVIQHPIDSVVPISRYTYSKYINATIDSFIYIDTTLDLFHQFDPVNKTGTFYRNTGSFGSAAFPLYFEPELDVGFHTGFRMFDIYRFTPENTRYFDTGTPFTQANYVQGANELQILFLNHTQNIKPNWNAGLKLERWRSEGFYTQQKILHTKFNLHSHYHSINKRYRMLLSINTNNIFNDENGGISGIDEWNLLIPPNKTNITVMLNNAEMEWRDRSIKIRNQYYFGPVSKDTIYTETDTFKTIHLTPVFSVSLDSRYSISKYNYEDNDPNPDLYPYTFFDENYTYDSITFKEFKNKFALNLHNWKAVNLLKPINFSTGITHSISNLSAGLFSESPYAAIDSHFENIATFFKINTSFYRFNFNLEGTNIFSGTLKNNYNYETSLNTRIRKNDQIRIIGQLSNRAPDFLFNQFQNNHFHWNHNYINIKTRKAFINYRIKDILNIISGYTRVENFTYLDERVLPQQSESAIEFFSLKLENKFKPGKFNLITAVLYQTEINTNIIRLPEFVVSGSINYQTTMFSEALITQFGLNASWTSTYISNAYMPLIGKMYHQNEVMTGNYPVLDLYINAKVKRVRFFLKVDHFNQGIWDNDNYFSAAYYPQSPRAFRIGLNWIFYD